MTERPKHYAASSIEPIDVIESWGLGFNLASVLKYIARERHKGTPLEDLRKAREYLTREITTREGSPRWTDSAPTHERPYENIAKQVGLVRIGDDGDACFTEAEILACIDARISDLGQAMERESSLYRRLDKEIARYEELFDRTERDAAEICALRTKVSELEGQLEQALSIAERSAVMSERMVGAARAMLEEADVGSESPETRARLEYACRPMDETRAAPSVTIDELFTHVVEVQKDDEGDDEHVTPEEFEAAKRKLEERLRPIDPPDTSLASGSMIADTSLESVCPTSEIDSSTYTDRFGHTWKRLQDGPVPNDPSIFTDSFGRTWKDAGVAEGPEQGLRPMTHRQRPGFVAVYTQTDPDSEVRLNVVQNTEQLSERHLELLDWAEFTGTSLVVTEPTLDALRSLLDRID